MKLFIDLGAFTGDTIESALKWYPRFDRYYGFEPLSSNYARCVQNLSGAKRVELINAAADIADGEANLYRGDAPGGSGGSLCDKTNCSPIDFERVRTVGISAWILAHTRAGDRVVLKVDVEGKEYDILEQMIETGAISRVSELYCEWHFDRLRNAKERHDRLISKLNEFGFGMTGNNREDEFHWAVRNWEKRGRLRSALTTDWRKTKLRMKYRNPAFFRALSRVSHMFRRTRHGAS